MKKRAIRKSDYTTLSHYGLGDELLHSAVHIYEAGEAIVTEGMPHEYLFLALNGRAKVTSTSANGKDILITYYLSEGIMGDIELMTDATISETTVVAMTEFSCIAIPIAVNRPILKSNNRFINIVATELAKKLLHTSGSYLRNSTHSAEERLCSYIIQNSIDGMFHEKLTDVAKFIAISYRHLARLLNTLVEDGVLEKNKPYYKIIKREELISRSSL